MRDTASPELIRLVEKDVAAVALFSTPIQVTDGRASLVVIRGDGNSAALPVGPLDNALLAEGPGRSITFSSESTTTTVDEDEVDAWSRGGIHGTGHWTGISESGQSVAVFNTGGVGDRYVTDVFFTDGKTRTHQVVPDVPGATGISKDAVWMLSGGSSNNDGRVTLYGVRTAGDSTPVQSEWYYHGGRNGGAFSHGSGIFSHRGELWYLEQVGPMDGPPAGLTLRLAQIDPMTGRYHSHRLGSLPRYLYDDSTGVNPLAAAAKQGHLHNGSLFTLNGEGELLQVNLDTKKVEVNGQVSAAARDSATAAASWAGDRLTVLFGSQGDDGFTLETYDLVSGKRLSELDVDLPHAVVADPDQLLWSLAVPRP